MLIYICIEEERYNKLFETTNNFFYNVFFHSFTIMCIYNYYTINHYLCCNQKSVQHAYSSIVELHKLNNPVNEKGL